MKPRFRKNGGAAPEPPLRDTGNLSKGQRRLGIVSVCALSLVLGFLCGLIVWGILRIMSLGVDLLWVRLPELLGLGRSLPYYLICCLIGGLLIGLMRKQYGPLPDNMEQVFGRIRFQGRYPYDRLHVVAVCALLPLIFGASLGPEAGLSGLIAGLCCWTADRLKFKGDQIAALTEAGFAAVLGVVFGAPLFGIAANLEPDDPSEHYRSKIVRKRTRIIIYCFGVAGGMAAFALLGRFFGSEGGLPRFHAQHAIGPDQWKWFLPLLALGIVFSLFYMLIERISRRLGERLDPHPIIICMIPAVLTAVSGYFLPLTMFSGEHQLDDLIDGWQSASCTELILTAVVRLALISLCINFGWRGGSIFPLIYSGACLGYSFALITGMDGAFAAAVLIASLYAYHMRKPVMVMMVLLLCFPITSILPVGIAAIIASKVPSPFARQQSFARQ